MPQASDIETDAVGVKDDSPKLSPLIVTMPPTERAIFTASLELTTGATSPHEPQRFTLGELRLGRRGELNTIEAEWRRPCA